MQGDPERTQMSMLSIVFAAIGVSEISNLEVETQVRWWTTSSTLVSR